MVASAITKAHRTGQRRAACQGERPKATAEECQDALTISPNSVVGVKLWVALFMAYNIPYRKRLFVELWTVKFLQ